MSRKTTPLVFILIATIIIGATGVMAASGFRGTGTATGTVGKNGASHARVGKSNKRLGKVYVTKVIVTDIFGHEREVTWRYAGGKGTSRPTIKFTGDDKPKKNEFVTLEIEFQANVELDAPLDAFIY